MRLPGVPSPEDYRETPWSAQPYRLLPGVPNKGGSQASHPPQPPTPDCPAPFPQQGGAPNSPSPSSSLKSRGQSHGPRGLRDVRRPEGLGSIEASAAQQQWLGKSTASGHCWEGDNLPPGAGRGAGAATLTAASAVTQQPAISGCCRDRGVRHVLGQAGQVPARVLRLAVEFRSRLVPTSSGDWQEISWSDELVIQRRSLVLELHPRAVWFCIRMRQTCPAAKMERTTLGSQPLGSGPLWLPPQSRPRVNGVLRGAWASEHGT